MIHDETTAGHLLQSFAPPDEFLQFFRALIEGGRIGDGREYGWSAQVIEFLEKPWHWATEFYAWDGHGRPMDASMPGWEAWLEAIE